MGAGAARALPIVAIGALIVSIGLQAVPDNPIAATWGGGLWTAAVPLLLATYPTGRFVPTWLVAPVVGYLAIAVVYVVTDGTIGQQWWWMPVALAQALFLVPALYRYRLRLSTTERESVRWAILGVLVGTVGMATLVAVSASAGGTINDLGAGASVLASVFILSYPLGCLIGLIRPRLAPVDAVLRWVLLITVSGVVLAAAFAVTTTALGTVASNAVTAWSGAAVVALATYPTTRLSARLADWIVYRGRPDAAHALVELGQRLNAQSDALRAPETIAGLARESLGLAGASLIAPGLIAAHEGVFGKVRIAFPLDYEGARVATLTVAPRAGETALTARDREVLEILARHAAPAIHGAIALADLTDARSRVVLAREEERKQLRRDLHDDLAPTLAGLGLTAAGIERMARDSRPGIEQVAARLLDDIRDAIAQTRQIAYGLRPRVLDDQGLVAAIRDRTQSEGAELVVDVHASADRLLLPAAVELAALRIVQEAVLNVRKHADATNCRIDVELANQQLEVRVLDDGRGIPVDPLPGIGLESIRTRAAELGGRAWIARHDSGGTLVRVLLPAGSAA